MMSTLRLTQSRIFIDDCDLFEILRAASTDFDPTDHNIAIDWASLAVTATSPGEATILFCADCSGQGFHSGMDIAIEKFVVVHTDREIVWQMDIGYSQGAVRVVLRFDRAQYNREVATRGLAHR